LECVDIQQAFVGKHWSELSQETLIKENSALSFLTNEAFRFYLPAYLSIVVRKFEETDILPDVTVQYLTLPVEADDLNKLSSVQEESNELQFELSQFIMEYLSRSNQKVHLFMERVSGLNQQQCQAIRYYLEYLNHEKKRLFLC
jgi:methyltransferase-like protein